MRGQQGARGEDPGHRPVLVVPEDPRVPDRRLIGRSDHPARDVGECRLVSHLWTFVMLVGALAFVRYGSAPIRHGGAHGTARWKGSPDHRSGPRPGPFSRRTAG